MHFISCFGEGITAQQASLIGAQHQYGRGRYVAVASEHEQHPGLLDAVRGLGIPVYVIDGLDDHKRFPALLRRVIGVLKQVRPSIVHVHTNWQLVLAWFARIGARQRFPIVYSLHAYRNFRPLIRPFARTMIDVALWVAADQVLFPSKRTHQAFPFSAKRGVVVHQAVEDVFFNPSNRRTHSDLRKLLMVAKFRRGKNQDLVIRALRAYIDATGNRDVMLTLVGDGEKLGFCRDLVKNLELDDFVVFAGFLSREEVIQQYLQCEFAVIASNSETFGRCIVEPYLLGSFIFSTRVGVAEELIRDGVSGVLFKDERDLSRQFIRYLPNPAARAAMPAAMPSRGAEFRLSTVVATVDGLYEQCLKRSVGLQRCESQ